MSTSTRMPLSAARVGAPVWRMDVSVSAMWSSTTVRTGTGVGSEVGEGLGGIDSVGVGEGVRAGTPRAVTSPPQATSRTAVRARKMPDGAGGRVAGARRILANTASRW